MNKFLGCILILLIIPLTISAHPSWGIVVDNERNIYFADIAHNGMGSVWKLKNTGELELLLQNFHAHNVSLDRDGNLITAHGEGNHTLVRINRSGSIDTLFHTKDYKDFFGGNCAWSARKDKIVYGLREHKHLRELDMNGNQLNIGDYEFIWNQSIYVAPNGTVYATEIGRDNGCIVKIDTTGKSSFIAKDLITKLNREKDIHNDILLGITEGCDGFIYVAETAGRRIVKLLNNGENETFYASKDEWTPTAIDFFSGDAYILEYKVGKQIKGPRIIKIDEFGKKSIIFNYDNYKKNVVASPAKKNLVGWIVGLSILIGSFILLQFINKKVVLSFLAVFILTFSGFAQFHTLKIPKYSNKVTESQTLGVTDITIDYHSPSVNDRDVWNNENIIPKNGDPIPWRAGANMATTIEFSTDVLIDGKKLDKGKYGFHIIPRETSHTLIFAHNWNQWGSYYLDMEKDVRLKVDVEPASCPFSEKLDYEFISWTDSSVTVGLEWADVRIPFTVSVDLDKTVVESLRSELRGENTYHWQAWNEAASWCLDRNTNLEEALEWADRSITGGYGGFAANMNPTNMLTKASILQSLGKEEELDETIDQITSLKLNSAMEANSVSFSLIRMNFPQDAISVCDKSIPAYPDAWFLHLNKSVALYQVDQHQAAIDELELIRESIPDYFSDRYHQIHEEMKAGKYQLPN